jgi:hypothetical protein
MGEKSIGADERLLKRSARGAPGSAKPTIAEPMRVPAGDLSGWRCAVPTIRSSPSEPCWQLPCRNGSPVLFVDDRRAHVPSRGDASTAVAGEAGQSAASGLALTMVGDPRWHCS